MAQITFELPDEIVELLLHRPDRNNFVVTALQVAIKEEESTLPKPPLTFEQAKALSHARYAEAYRELAK